MIETNLTSKGILSDWALTMPLGVVPQGMNVPLPVEGTTPVEFAELLGESYLAFVRQEERKNVGHYQTPAGIAKFMAECASYSKTVLRVLDPGSGTGILSAAVCEAACQGRVVNNLHIDAYETDHLLAGFTHLVLAFSRHWLGRRGVALTFDVKYDDFVLEYSAALEPPAGHNGHQKRPNGILGKYDLVVSNPPYFKIGKDDPRAIAGSSVVHGQPNIYSLFMAISAELLFESGMLVYIVPRSFSSGPYFRRFREVFFQRVTPTAIHLFESRRDVFKNQAVLQENLVLTAQRRRKGDDFHEGQVYISHSRGADDLSERRRLVVGLDFVLDLESDNKELRIPVCPEDVALVRAVRAWPNTLSSLGLEISTGPVVPFRANQFLADAPSDVSTVPLLWMHHVRPMRVEWPSAGNGKPQRVKVTPDSAKLLARNDTYVLLRRFSAKEEKRRLVAAPLVRDSLGADMVGLENHLNYIRGVSRELDEELAWGIAALLNSAVLDRYFRVSNGNTQVSATELRAMPLPDEGDIRSVGAFAHARADTGPLLTEIDDFVAGTLNLSSTVGLGRRENAE